MTMKLPTSLQKTIDFFERLPGIGPKSAKRLGFQLLRIPQEDLLDFAETIKKLKSTSLRCSICLNLTEQSICPICKDKHRDQSTIAVVEEVLDLISIDYGGKYSGVFHVLHGRIDPLNYIGPDDISIKHLLNRIVHSMQNGNPIKEIILATNPNTEGEATAMYIRSRLNDLKKEYKQLSFKVSRLAYGLPIGADLEYADYITLHRAMEGRREF